MAPTCAVPGLLKYERAFNEKTHPYNLSKFRHFRNRRFYRFSGGNDHYYNPKIAWLLSCKFGTIACYGGIVFEKGADKKPEQLIRRARGVGQINFLLREKREDNFPNSAGWTPNKQFCFSKLTPFRKVSSLLRKLQKYKIRKFILQNKFQFFHNLK